MAGELAHLGALEQRARMHQRAARSVRAEQLIDFVWLELCDHATDAVHACELGVLTTHLLRERRETLEKGRHIGPARIGGLRRKLKLNGCILIHGNAFKRNL